LKQDERSSCFFFFEEVFIETIKAEVAVTGKFVNKYWDEFYVATDNGLYA
jgi:hypothetical protein